jgi:ATP-dependent DNA helicase RecG
MASFSPGDLFDTLKLAEDASVEFKEASGRDGQGHLPQSVFETYSAMANCNGGAIVLGIKELPDSRFVVHGIQNPAKVTKEWWDAINNKQKVSVNILHDSDVRSLSIDGKRVLLIDVRRASRSHRPVFVGINPLTGTYKRNHEGDYLCDAETVKRMLAEQVEPERDGKLLHGYTMEDLHVETFRAYRQQFANTKRNHAWTSLEDTEFLRSIGGWTKDRSNGDEGLTLAGVLMFGKLSSIQECVPNYMLDYQEIPEPKTSMRWSDRLITDGNWSGNLFDFYRIVISKLYRDLKVPFQLAGGQRKDDTPVHEALREALVNTLIHADYSERVSILVVKRPDLFGFRNPGLMRVSIDDALKGGNSDCRNRRLQKMFLLVGFAEQAGSGIPKIWMNWHGQHWRAPNLAERSNPDQTLLSLRMLALFPDSALTALDERFGDKWKSLSETQRVALATVAIDRTITHARLKSMCVDHSSDVSKALHNLVKDGYLESFGAARGTFYAFPGEHVEDQGADEEELLGIFARSVQSIQGSEQMSFRSEQMASSSEQITGRSVQITEISEQMTRLMELGKSVRARSKVSQTVMRDIILQLCEADYATLTQLAQALGREKDTLRVHYLNPLVQDGKLARQYPQQPNHPGQAYKSL